MDENINAYVIDTSYVLSFLMPDEQSEEAKALFERYGNKEVLLLSTTLLEYEIANALRTNVLRNRITPLEAKNLLGKFKTLGISTYSADTNEMFEISLKHNISCYDAAYIALARVKKAELLTFDERLKRISRIV